jgi:hypothetical protein
MNSFVTSWAFGFGGWMGVFGSTFLFLNIPSNSTFLTILLSPWLGGLSLYLFMFGIHAWMNLCAHITSAMLRSEIILAVLTACMGVLIVSLARVVINMERGHRTPAEEAAEESATTPAAVSAAVSAADTGTEHESGEESDEEDGSDDDEEDGSDDGSNEENEGDDAENEGDDEENEGDDEENEGDDEENEGDDEENEGDDEEDEEKDDDEENADSSRNEPLNEAAVDSTASYENINTPQLSALVNTSPVPNMSDI